MRARMSMWCVLASLIVLLAAGCGSRPAPTRGVLTFDGKPLPKASVLFMAQDAGGKDATGFTRDDGAFELTTFRRNDGALPGSYKVIVQCSPPTEAPATNSPAAFREASANAARSAPIIPEVYTRLDQTPLRHRVPQDGDAKLVLVKNPPQP